MFLALPICRTDVVPPSKVPKTKQTTSVEDASLPASRTAWHLISTDCIEPVLLAVVVQYFYFHLVAIS